MTVTLNEWAKYRDLLSKISQKAADEFQNAVWGANGRWKGAGLGAIPREDLVDYAYALVTKYSEGSTELACQMYDKMAALSGKKLPPAEPSETASYWDVNRSLTSAIQRSSNQEYVSSTLSRFVKQASQDTTLKNAKRDRAEFAWVPSGDPCPFCIAIASNGWRTASSKSSTHAEHIHNNCNCAYMVRFDSSTEVEGYDPDKYLEQYKDAEGKSSKEKINSMRRMQYQENKDRINEQKREAYAERQKTDFIQKNSDTIWSGKPTEHTKEEISELRDYAKDKGIKLDPSFTSFDGDIDLVKDFIDTIDENIRDKDLESNKSIVLKVKYKYKDDEEDANTYAETQHSTIIINGNAYRDREILKADYEEQVKEHFFTQNSSYIDIATHETAHVITNMNQLKYEGMRESIFGKDDNKAIPLISDNISKYALKNNKELIAESYVAYKNGSRNEYVLKVLEYCGIL